MTINIGNILTSVGDVLMVSIKVYQIISVIVQEHEKNQLIQLIQLILKTLKDLGIRNGDALLEKDLMVEGSKFQINHHGGHAAPKI